MEKYLYLTIMPETLVASMLPPEEFGTYLAIGSQRKIPRETIFFSLDPAFTSNYFDLSLLETSCVPHEDGNPKRSVYISIYRVLENIPLNAIKSLYLTTRDGRVLELSQGTPPEDHAEFHLYAELCPVCPLAMSALSPTEFCKFVTTPDHPLHIPKIFFMNMTMPDLNADDTFMGVTSIHSHIIETFKSLSSSRKKTKIVDRRHEVKGWNHGIKDGFYIGDPTGILFFPMPSAADLELNHHKWWRSANL